MKITKGNLNIPLSLANNHLQGQLPEITAVYGRKVGIYIMIRSVSRFAVEINKPDSPYFERVICFVRPQYTENGSIDLHRAALEYIEEINENVECCSSAPEPREEKNPFLEKILGLPRWALITGAAVLGSVMTILGTLLII